MPPYTHGTWIVKPGREDEFVRLWEELADWTIAEGFSARGTLLRDAAQPNCFVSFGPWQTLDDIDRWRSAQGFRERLDRLREVLESFEPRTLHLVLETS
jgi:heme-degrading monooxygenase HmoA